MWLLHSSLNSSSVFTSAETQGSACHFWTLSDTAWAQQQLTDGDTWDGEWGHSEMSVCVTRMFWGQVVGRGLDHGGQSCLTFNELAVVLLLVRRAVHCAIPPTAVKQRILWGHGTERDTGYGWKSWALGFQTKLSQELDSILKTFFVPDMWLFWARKFLYTVHRWRRAGTGGNGRSSGYRKSLRENSSNPLKATCNNVMLKFFLCALFLSFSLFLLVYSSFLVSSTYFLPPFFSLFPPAFLLYVFFFPSFCHPLLFLLPSILHFFFLPSLLHDVIPYFPFNFLPSILYSFILSISNSFPP